MYYHVESPTTPSLSMKVTFCTKSMTAKRYLFVCLFVLSFLGVKQMENNGLHVKIGTAPSRNEASLFGCVNG